MGDRGNVQERQYQTKYFGVPLKRILPDEDPDTAVVRGFFTSDDKDEAGDIITKGATERAIVKYRKWGNVRYMHLPKPVGRITRIGTEDGLDWNEVEIHVIDPQAVFEVRNGLLTALSVGIFIDFDDLEFLEDGGLLINDYTLCELSLVDHPANYDAFLTSIKGAMHAYTNLPLETQAELQQEGVTMGDTVLEPLARGGGYRKVQPEVEEQLPEATAVEIVEEEIVEPEEGELIEKDALSIEPLESVQVEELDEESPEKGLPVEQEAVLETEETVPEPEETVLETKSPACRQTGETEEECVARKIPELMDEGMDHDQAVAAAHSICSEECKSCSQEEDVGEEVQVEEISLESLVLALFTEIDELKHTFAIYGGMLKVMAEALPGQDERPADEDNPSEDHESLQRQLEEALIENRELKDEIQLLKQPVERKGHVQANELPEAQELEQEQEQEERSTTLKQAVRRHLERRYTARG